MAIVRALLEHDSEEKTIRRFIAKLQAGRTAPLRVLDAGCGYGRNLRLLKALGCSVLGVEINAEIVAANRKQGLDCQTPAELEKSSEKFDLIVMSHVIEHFMPEALLGFMDSYLDRLREGGHLLIATPLHTAYFHDDFDHVKPYRPMGILMVFGEGASQVQYYARNKLALEDLWFRRGYFRFSHARAKHVRSPIRSRLIKLVELASALAFIASFELFGQANGWVGLFRKAGPARA